MTLDLETWTHRSKEARQITIRNFDATDDAESCRQIAAGHARAMASIGFAQLALSPTWAQEPGVKVLLAEDERGRPLGSIRVHPYDGSHSIPLMRALEKHESVLLPLLDQAAIEGTGEVCGLWSARSAHGTGLGELLCTSAVAVLKGMGLASVYCLAAPHTADLIRKHGCVPVRELGNEGEVPYPMPGIMSIVLKNPDLRGLSHAGETQRSNIEALHRRPSQTLVHTGPLGQRLTVRYQLSF